MNKKETEILVSIDKKMDTNNELMKKMLLSMREWMVDDIRQHEERIKEYKKSRRYDNGETGQG